MSIESNIAESDNLFLGEDKILQYTVTDSAGAIQVITGWALEWVLRSAAGHGTALLTKTVGSGITITNGAGGILQVAIADDDTLSMAPDTYYYTLRRTDAAFEVVLAFGTVVLRQPATR